MKDVKLACLSQKETGLFNVLYPSVVTDLLPLNVNELKGWLFASKSKTR